MPDREHYSRVYWGIVDDPKFDAIYDDDHHLAAWLRMLLGAEHAFPNSALIPANVHRASVAALVDARLIAVTGRRYRVVGLDAERRKRSESGRHAARVRWQSERNAPALQAQSEGNAEHMLGRGLGREEIPKGKQGASPLERARAIGVVHPEGETA